MQGSKSTATLPPKHDWSLPDRPGLVVEDENEYARAADAGPVLAVEEAERYTEQLRKFTLEEVGSSSWFDQHVNLLKLNIQAHQSAMARSDEFVLEAMLTFDKVGVLVHELLLIEVWKEMVLPHLLETERVRSGKCGLRLFFTINNEATLVNLLEVVLYHGHVLEEAGDAVVELVDYCARKVTMLNSSRKFAEPRPGHGSSARQFAASLLSQGPKEQLQSRMDNVDFHVCVTAVTMLRYLCEHLHRLPLAAASRMLDVHDVLLGLVPLVENPPWTRRTPKGQWQKLIDFKWTDVPPTDLLKITKTEAQVWIAMFHLMCQPECRRRYHFNSFRKTSILRVRKYLNDVMLDQLPVLADVQRYMDELALMEVPEASQAPAPAGLLMQQVPLVREGLLGGGRDWAALAAEQASGTFGENDDADDPDVRRVGAVYVDDSFQDILDPMGEGTGGVAGGGAGAGGGVATAAAEVAPTHS